VAIEHSHAGHIQDDYPSGNDDNESELPYWNLDIVELHADIGVYSKLLRDQHDNYFGS
jgi:hypothetical protein